MFLVLDDLGIVAHILTVISLYFAFVKLASFLHKGDLVIAIHLAYLLGKLVFLQDSICVSDGIWLSLRFHCMIVG